MQGLAFLLLAGSWVTYQQSIGSSADVAFSQQSDTGELSDLISNSLYASCVFVLLCAWGYLALERWRGRPLSSLTTFVFAALMALVFPVPVLVRVNLMLVLELVRSYPEAEKFNS